MTESEIADILQRYGDLESIRSIARSCGRCPKTIKGVLSANGVKIRSGPAPQNIKGMKFGRLTALEYFSAGKWECECECGQKKFVHGVALRDGSVKSCGCLLTHQDKQRDLSGQQFYKITVLGFSHVNKISHKRSERIWDCVCDCGQELQLSTARIKHKYSCGCERKPEQKRRPKKTKTARYCGSVPITYVTKVRDRAGKKGIDFNISVEDVDKLFVSQRGLCALSGMEIVFAHYNSDVKQTASIDRIDSKLGYVKGNIQIVHKDINVMKNIFTQEYFIELCGLVSRKMKI